MPAQARPAVLEAHDRNSARPAASSLLQAPQATARCPRVDAPAVVDDLHHDVLADVEGDGHRTGARVPHRVADPLPDDGLHIGGEVAGDPAVHGTRHPHRRPELVAGRLGDDVEQPSSQAVAVARAVGGVQVEDRRTDVPHGLVELIDRRADPLGRFRVADAGQGALQAEACGEHPLDHVVVQVARDPVTVLGHIGPADHLLPGGQVQGQCGLVGKCADQGGE